MKSTSKVIKENSISLDLTARSCNYKGKKTHVQNFILDLET